MAKKTTRRPNLSQETLARARQEMYGSTPAEDAPTPAEPHSNVPVAPRRRTTGVPSKVAAAAARPVDLRQEYAYVVHDLQTMGMLAAALMIILVALSFFL
ncbi:MAG TPA: hypothetical protein PKD09_22590 [Aggregatilinea sp.]|jgi:hypothetical protein|uniref:hypothetical protein n=1 Tax=Aggregatilinea sp. TaxID=2806333 RepID=UPI002BD448DA|nr:hypothetical protein [Aggregatilinea sp.]HML24460.1 hypothetical protein [Aggregatilinea sp.]